MLSGCIRPWQRPGSRLSPSTGCRRAAPCCCPNARLRLASSTAVQLAHRVDGIGLGRTLVRPITDDAGEAQREATRIRRARLDAVEGNLDHELRADMYDVSIPAGLELEELRSLPLEQGVGHALERLAQHDEPS